ncbi:hypothetical protein SERLADRAFT_359056 [Serpula lacrymans var. lacrymans S7.9]|uniref:Ketoreductase domain-containing protein n=1 Tax=Serpula lacrymans var. lacrymans (strain S7.9) TaxID=578457 RepID=F8NFV0_SERL9|nr:uncharacterized protein SERLADRAFT_359056 [Serpula lacrymans var. lacrymans S7.9]EGO30920.1 hypothetical protein SERLADRAFT_359056 [Serpula lacrymans var. lacrymans S7.9]
MSSLQVENLFGVAGKVVLVTGGTRGIGKMIASGYVRNGAKVYITSRSAKDCDATAKEFNALVPGSCVALAADLQKLEEVQRLAGELSSREKALHVLVNNAGATWAAPVDDHPDDGFTKVVTLNLQRVFTLTQKLLPLLRAAASGVENNVYYDPARIINIGSVEGIGVPDHDTYAYAAAKAGLHHLSRHLGGRLGPEGIVSNTIACVTAQFLQAAGDVVVSKVPLNRFGTPEDVAGTCLFLSSRAGAYVNGATIALDGGFLVSMPLSKL